MGDIRLTILRNSLIFFPAHLNLFKKSLSRTSAISAKSPCEYLLKSIIESNLLIKALSKWLNRFVVASKTIRSSNLSNSFSNVDVARPISRRSFEFVLSNAIESISSNSTITFSGWANSVISRNSETIFFCVCPSLLSIMAEIHGSVFVQLAWPFLFFLSQEHPEIRIC